MYLPITGRNANPRANRPRALRVLEADAEVARWLAAGLVMKVLRSREEGAFGNAEDAREVTACWTGTKPPRGSRLPGCIKAFCAGRQPSPLLAAPGECKWCVSANCKPRTSFFADAEARHIACDADFNLIRTCNTWNAAVVLRPHQG